jgi:HAD superfamily hydrolase (TIGR01509 family)
MTGWNEDRIVTSRQSAAGEPLRPLLLFDVNGVLFEFDGGPSTLFPTSEDAWELWSTSPSVRQFEAGYLSTPDFLPKLVKEMDLNLTPAELYRELVSWPTGPFPGMALLLETLQQLGYRLATFSNTNPIHWPMVLQASALDRLAHAHYPSHITGILKPSAEAFEFVAVSEGFSPGNIIYFDDQLPNIQGAKDAGLSAYLVKGVREVRATLDALGILAV